MSGPRKNTVPPMSRVMTAFPDPAVLTTAMVCRRFHITSQAADRLITMYRWSHYQASNPVQVRETMAAHRMSEVEARYFMGLEKQHACG